MKTDNYASPHSVISALKWANTEKDKVIEIIAESNATLRMEIVGLNRKIAETTKTLKEALNVKADSL